MNSDIVGMIIDAIFEAILNNTKDRPIVHALVKLVYKLAKEMIPAILSEFKTKGLA